MLALFLPAIRADLTILDTYQYGEEPALAFPITAFGGDRDPSVSRTELEQWRVQTTGAFRLRMFAGDHFFVQSAQELVLQALNQELAQHLR
jgi:medium-chain acyl-[acyl-carrier-protein] hydrolase